MYTFNFNYDFSNLNLSSLHQTEGITTQEIKSVYENIKNIQEAGGGAKASFIAIGYSNKKRILLIAFLLVQDIVAFVGAKVASEHEIDTFYCGKK